MNICLVDNCTSAVLARSLCNKHYLQYKNGKLDIEIPCSKHGRAMRWILEHKNYDGDECIYWPFARSSNGYGNIVINGKNRVASRVMCEIAHGEPVESNLDAAHSCGKGTDGCMNPKHLSWKTHTENERDKNDHGTRFRGSDCSFSKHDWPLVRMIKEKKGLMRNKDVADMFSVDRRFVSRVWCGHSWKDEHDPLNKVESAS